MSFFPSKLELNFRGFGFTLILSPAPAQPTPEGAAFFSHPGGTRGGGWKNWGVLTFSEHLCVYKHPVSCHLAYNPIRPVGCSGTAMVADSVEW